ncbi:outer membrane beta-barrel protein [Flavobacterium tegetincola]|uniref:outer membrane beta-barrel protein n=1 Tax=Flavobacterium tegetincola TaxID=150172 RepID=UPI0003F58083|nr:outer membrane beta-barrel protein [Flavobacterium tegetincola]
MNDKKNIDRLFQERFKDFEAVPDEQIWSNIHDALHEKKRKKVIPLWWKFSGIAAGFLLAFLAFNTFWSPSETETRIVISPEKTKQSDAEKPNVPTETKIAVEDPTEINVEENSTKSTRITRQKTIVKSNLNSRAIKKQNGIAVENTAIKKSTQNQSASNAIQNQKAEIDQIVSNNYIKSVGSENSFEDDYISINKEKIADKSRNSSVNNDALQKEKDALAVTLVAEPNPLEEILKKKNEKETAVAVVKINRWNVTTNVAPVFFSSAGNGSPIEAQFEGNSKTFENNLSVGIGVQYAVNKKLSVRSGVNKVSLGYGTNDVVFFGGINSSGVSNLSTTMATSNIEVISANNIAALRPFEDNLLNTESGVLNQRMGYYEVPLELSYAVVDRKIGVRVIGGLSTLFLNENSVSVQSANTTMSLGKANNLNDIHFSGNAGVGFNYKFWNSFEAHFEPTFKYQFNTFSRDAGNFKPYFVGLYTGVSFRF